MGKAGRAKKTLIITTKRQNHGSLLWLAVAAIAVGAAWWAVSMYLARPTMERAREQLAAGDTRGAAQTLSAIVASNGGNLEARKQLGMLYLNKTSGLFNTAKALEHLQPVANAGDVEAQKRIAAIFLDGNDAAKDPIRGIPYLKRAADSGDAESQYTLGSLLYHGGDAEQNPPQAFEYLSRAAGNGVEAAKPLVGLMYYRGQGVSQNFAMALRYLEPYAESGDIAIQIALGDIHRANGDPRAAHKHYLKAYTLGDDEAGRALGLMYYRGEGVERDPAQAKHFLQPLADRGDGPSQGILAAISYDEAFYRGAPPPARRQDAVLKLAAAAAQKNDPTGQFVLGALYYRGIGAREGAAPAREFLERGAASGDPLASRLLGDILYHGDGVPRDVDRGLYFIEAAARKMEPIAMELLERHRSIEEAEKRHAEELLERQRRGEEERKRAAEDARRLDAERRLAQMKALERARSAWDERLDQVGANESARLAEQEARREAEEKNRETPPKDEPESPGASGATGALNQ